MFYIKIPILPFECFNQHVEDMFDLGSYLLGHQSDFKQDPAAQVNATKKLNDFVEKSTKWQIRNVFNKGVIDEETTAVIVNAMHLKMNFRSRVIYIKIMKKREEDTFL
ncbi:hypothetical protein QR680_008012 [Steinernema hermaphroditum]|uniref:Serpin domain-containing protein n=1 Tax=Steinernema hermaphroditum TaxID=289476 RepID=A0AA39IGK8_9BILA|nr:hypothetical protein QR680_008012 [Steinernema hermaphroditum]